MKRLFVAMAALTTSVLGVQAQNTTGLLLNRDIIPASTFVSLSQRESAGTARSMAMGGAFTSLGGDMASFGYNPAGFGMYQRNEISVSLGLGVSRALNYNAYNNGANSSTRFSINNFGASFQVYEGTGKLTAVNFAFGYNKVADYNYNLSTQSLPTVSSLADAFADMANGGGLTINSDNKITDSRGYYDYEMNPYYWGTVLAYKSGLINRGSNGWYPDEIAGGAEMTQYTSLKSRGSAGEYSLAFGFNFSNVVYLGASLDIQSIERRQTIYYTEYINYGAGAKPNPSEYPYQLRDFDFNQSMLIDGTGLGAKFGIIVRPVEALRIGFAVHTPTYYSVLYRYSANLSSKAWSAADDPYGWASSNGFVYADEETPVLYDKGDFRWRFTTPTRLLAGLSCTIGQYAVISADYEYDAYRGLKLNYAPTDPGYDNSLFRNSLKGVHIVRAGIEAKPTPWLSLRVGGGYKTGILRPNYDYVALSEPIDDTSWYASAGLGFRLGKVTSIDLAYQYRNIRYSDYYAYRTQLGAIPNASPLYGLDIMKHNIAMTFAFRF